MDLQEIMRQAKSIQENLKTDLAKMAVESSSGGGAVRVVVNGSKEVTQIDIQEHAMDDRDMLADMILAALNRAYADVNARLQDQLSSVMGGLDLANISNMFGQKP